MNGHDAFDISKSMRLPSGQRVRFRTKRAFFHPLVEGRVPQKTTSARMKGKEIGAITTHDIGNEILHVAVDPKVQRKGVATGMLRQHEARVGTVKHSAIRTKDGNGWAASLGVKPVKPVDG